MLHYERSKINKLRWETKAKIITSFMKASIRANWCDVFGENRLNDRTNTYLFS